MFTPVFIGCLTCVLFCDDKPDLGSGPSFARFKINGEQFENRQNLAHLHRRREPLLRCNGLVGGRYDEVVQTLLLPVQCPPREYRAVGRDLELVPFIPRSDGVRDAAVLPYKNKLNKKK